MFTFSDPGAAASTAAATPNVPSNSGDGSGRTHIRHLLFGTPQVVNKTIKQLHKLNYASPTDWSRPIPTGNPGEVMATLTKRIIP